MSNDTVEPPAKVVPTEVAIEQGVDETHLWFDGLRFTSERPLEPAEVELLRSRLASLRTWFWVMINGVAALAAMFFYLHNPASWGMTLATVAVGLWWWDVQRTYLAALSEPVLEFCGALRRNSGESRVVAKNGKIELVKQGDGSLNVKQALTPIVCISERMGANPSLTAGELQELSRHFQRQHPSFWLLSLTFLTSAFFLPGALSAGGKFLVAVSSQMLAGFGGALTLLIVTRAYNRRIKRVIDDGTVRPNYKGDKLLLADGVVWMENGLPAEWRRKGYSYPQPEFPIRRA